MCYPTYKMGNVKCRILYMYTGEVPPTRAVVIGVH